MNLPRFLLMRVLAVAAMTLSLSGFTFAQDDRHSNLLTNGDFSKGMEGWEYHSWAQNSAAVADPSEMHDGHPSIRIDNTAADDAMVKQKVTLKPGMRYKMSAWIKTKGVGPMGAAKEKSKHPVGASVAVVGNFERSEGVINTKSWTHVSFEFGCPPKGEVEIGPRLGFYGSQVVGSAWFADLTLVEVGTIHR